MKKGIKKGLIITGTVITIAVSSVAGGYFLAEKIIGPPDDNDKPISGIEKAKIEALQQEREEQILEQGIEEARKEHPGLVAPSNP